ncbi:MAG: 4Fe-4S binding protein [Anaerolineae bacterium]|nr:4Fe-4S binding protein [Anaerolineae bacterium]
MMDIRRLDGTRDRPTLLLRVDEALCLACGACVAVCPPNALFLRGLRLTVDQAQCTDCERCAAMCPVQALSLIPVSPSRAPISPSPISSNGRGSP